jgi:hypothetical protein
MKRIFNLLQWVGLAVVVALILVNVFKPVPPMQYHPETWTQWTGFLAISYPGVSKDGTPVYASEQQFDEHIRALKQAGFNPIKVSDAYAFLTGKYPLPERALLILLEGGRKSTFIRSHSALSKYGFCATICVPSSEMVSWSESPLKKSNVRRISKMREWSVAGMGHRAIEWIPVSEKEVKGHFLTERLWLSSESRKETDAEFTERVRADYAKCAELLRKVDKTFSSVYVYPFADNGNRPGADPLAPRVNLQGVSSNFAAAFVSASYPFNPAGTDIYNLSHLCVKPTMSGEDLVMALKAAWPNQRAISWMDSSRWVLQENARVERDVLILPAQSAAWLKGSELWRDVEIEATVEREASAVAACFVSAKPSGDFVRLALTPLSVRMEKVSRGKKETVVMASLPADRVIKFRWVVKGDRSWLDVNGRRVFGPVPVGQDDFGGKIGFEAREDRVALRELSIRMIQRTAAMAGSWESVAGMAERLTDYIPQVVVSDKRPVLPMEEFMSVKAKGIAVWPMVSGAAGVGTDEIADALRQEEAIRLVDGFIVDAENKALMASLNSRGFRVMVRVNSAADAGISLDGIDGLLMEERGPEADALVNTYLKRSPPKGVLSRINEEIAESAGACVYTSYNGGGEK